MKCSAETGYVFLAAAFALVPDTVHICFAAQLSHSYSVVFVSLTACFGILQVVLLAKVSLSNPGFLAETNPFQASVNGRSLEVTNCTTCNLPKPPRAHHCKVCNRCIQRLDHHCPWVANCIGSNNQRSFVTLLLVSEFHAAYLILANLSALVFLDEYPGGYFGEALLIAFGVVMFWSVAGILFYQLYLVATNQTTHEHRRHLYKDGNPFNKGCWHNCGDFWRMKLGYALTFPSLN